MEKDLQNIIDNTLSFIKSYEFETPMGEILGTDIIQLKVLYKGEYFNPNTENYQKGIGDIIVIFDSNYRVVIKETIGGTWCFALLNAPYRVVEEYWHINEEQKRIIPELRASLEQGFQYRNAYSNLYIIDKNKNKLVF